ncbi:MAG TPA: PAS domain S-box protein [Thermoanaerobaculia bacterium]|nr:PAS domain S-box protein [Thermoanaerobaculia bacterium]
MIRPKTVSVSATRPAAVGVLGACVMAVVFLVDLATPLGYLDGILYTIPVLLGLWVPGARYALSAAAVATLLIALDMGLSTRAAVPMTVAVVDRLGAVAILWGLAAAIAWRKRRDAMIEHLSAIVESSDDAIIGSTLEGVVTSVNAGAERLFDVAAADVVGRRVEELLPHAARDAERLLARIRAGETLEHVEIRRARRDGSEIWVSLRVSPVRDPGGQITGASTIAHDISGRKAAEERLALVLRNAPVLLLRLDVEGRITFAEGEPLAALGTTAAELAGKPVAALFGQEEWVVDQMRRVLSGEGFTAGGKAAGRWWENHYVPLRGAGGAVTGAVAVSVDVTARKEAEEALVRQEALARLGTMAAVVAHEVKNPLAGIGGAIQVLRDRLPAEAGDREILTEVLGRLKGLNALVQDLLDFARPRAPRFARVSLGTTLRETAALLAADPANAGLRVEIEGPDVTLVGDADFLRDVFHNLLLNGAQAAAGRGPLRVTIEERGERCRVTVRDEGPGIPADLAEKVFEPFFTTKHRGTGLGLSIARRLVEAHGGTLSLASPPGGGTVAVVELPVGGP